MSWKAEADEIHRRRKLAEQCGGPDAVAKHHAAGKLTVRERIAGILDAGSFQEVGKLAGRGRYDAEGNLVGFEPAPYVMGIGEMQRSAPAEAGTTNPPSARSPGFSRRRFSHPMSTSAALNSRPRTSLLGTPNQPSRIRA